MTPTTPKSVRARTLGHGGPSVTPVGFGAMGMSWAYTEATPDLRSYADVLRAAARHAADLDAPVLVDTADLYGPFTNERLVGATLAGRNDVVIATKGGLVVDDASAWAIHRDGRPEHLSAAVEGSLQRLAVDVLDLYYLHRVDDGLPLSEQWGALSDLVHQGKIRRLGLSEVTIEQVTEAHGQHPVSAVQSELSLWTRDHLPVVDWCRTNGAAFVAYAPLGRGYLTGRFTTATPLPAWDLRSVNPRFRVEARSANERVLRVIRAVAVRRDASPAQVALAWVLAQGDHVIPIPGTKRHDRLVENTAAARLRLTDIDLAELDALPPPFGDRS